MDRNKLIKDLDEADLFIRGRCLSSDSPLNEYDISILQDAAAACNQAARYLEKYMYTSKDFLGCDGYSEKTTLFKLLLQDPCDMRPPGTVGCSGCRYEHLLEAKEFQTEEGWGIEVNGSCFEARYTDYLLDMGVIVPPCKIGSTVYRILCSDLAGYLEYQIGEGQIVEIRQRLGHNLEIIEKRHIPEGHCDFYPIPPEAFGDTVFLNKADAEEALNKIKNKSKNK